MTISYVEGDATRPRTWGISPTIIVHICNDGCRWGRGFVLALGKIHAEAEIAYRKAGPQQLGTIQVVDIEGVFGVPDITVINMIAQHGIHWVGHQPPIRYDALRECLQKVAVEAKKRNASIHMPRIGCGLAGGDWDTVSQIIEVELDGIDVTVYDFKNEKAPWYVRPNI